MNLKLTVELLNDINYERWARDMMILIAGKGLTFIVDGTEKYPVGESEPASTTGETSTASASTPTLTKEQLKWKSRDVMAKALFASHMEPHFRRKYWSSESSKKMLSALRKQQEQTGAEHFHRINDDIRSLKVADFPTVLSFNEKFKSLLCDLALCDSPGNGMCDMEAAYIVLRALRTGDEAWRTFRHIHCNANKPQQLMDEMVKQESRLKSERKNGGAPSGGEVMYSQSGNAPTSSLNENPRRGNLRERGGRDMTIICHNCGKKGHKKKECWSRVGVAGSDSGNRGREEEAELQAEDVIPIMELEMEANLHRPFGASMEALAATIWKALASQSWMRGGGSIVAAGTMLPEFDPTLQTTNRMHQGKER